LDESERYREPGCLERQEPRLRRVKNLNEAQLIGIEVARYDGYVGHLAVIHPKRGIRLLKEAILAKK
jgi:hypothetical protein